MKAYICSTCGTQFEKSDIPPPKCIICEDERQYVPAGGQSWTSLDAMKRRYSNSFKLHEENLFGVGTTPQFGIGQRALLLRTKGGNILWDCISLLDEATVQIIKALGGLAAIAISHPHYYGSMIEWSQAFSGVPIYLHEADEKWIMRRDENICLWRGDSLAIGKEVTLVRCGGHFPGGTVLHWAKGSEGKGSIFAGDIIMVTSDQKSVSFMRSYPNLIPLSQRSIEHIIHVLEPLHFERIYGPFFERNILKEGKSALTLCASRYINAIRGGCKDEQV